MKLSLVGALYAAAALAACVGPVRNPHVSPPLRAVVTDRYLGHWFEVARYDQPFERGCEGVTADYGRLPDGRLSVVNTCHVGGVGGRVRQARGSATLVPDSGGARLKVRFSGVPWAGDYWVLNHDDAYSWAVVGEGSGRFLWLLARTPLEGEARDALLRNAAELGYPTAPLHITRQAELQ